MGQNGFPFLDRESQEAYCKIRDIPNQKLRGVEQLHLDDWAGVTTS